LRIAGAVGLVLLLAACSKYGGSNPNIHAADYLVRGNGIEIKSLDPHYIDGNYEANVVGDILIGLTTEDAHGEPMPGAALSWQTSPDGKTWTFHLRDHVWSDGVPVTAEDFVYAWRRILEPARGAPYAYYLWLIKNGQAISGGQMPPSALGVKATDDKTLVVTLEHPAPYMLEYLLHQAVYPVPRHVVEAKGDAWAKPENYVGNGPYLPKEWVPNDHLTLAKNPRFYDAANVKLARVVYRPTTDTMAALKSIRAGELDTQYLVPTAEISWMRHHIPRALQLNVYLSNAYISTNFQRGPYKDLRLRQAISLAIDREVITDRILRIGDKPAYAFVPPGVANYPGKAHVDFMGMSWAARLDRARALMAQIGYGPSRHFHTTFDTNTTPDAKRIAAVVQAMLKDVYIDADVVTSDSQFFYKKLQEGDFDMATGAWVGDFNDASTFLDLLQSGSGNNYGKYSSPRYDALLAKADATADAAARGQILQQAEQIALDDVGVIPLRFLVTQDIVEPYVKGWIPNVRDFNRTRWLSIDPSAGVERGD
jgi:oligopeptide transport system substrate-binding protein